MHFESYSSLSYSTHITKIAYKIIIFRPSTTGTMPLTTQILCTATKWFATSQKINRNMQDFLFIFRTHTNSYWLSRNWYLASFRILRHMRLFPMRTFSASANGESCLGPVFRPLTDSDQHSFRYSHVISVFRHFLHKITN